MNEIKPNAEQSSSQSLTDIIETIDKSESGIDLIKQGFKPFL